MDIGEFFKYFGIAIAVLFVDAICCGIIIFFHHAEEDDDWWLGPLIVNVLGFAVVAAILIGERIG